MHSVLTHPVRLQLSRRKGFNLQTLSRETNGLEAVKVDRSTKWGNRFVIGSPVITPHGERVITAEEAVANFRLLITRIDTPEERTHFEKHFGANAVGPDLADVVRELRGKNLACWCQLDGQPCHADVLLEIANK